MKSSAIVKVEKHVSKQVEKLVKRSKEIFGKVVKTRQKLESEQRNFSVFESHFGVWAGVFGCLKFLQYFVFFFVEIGF